MAGAPIDDAVWAEVESARLRLADLLDGLSREEWESPSLCGGWRVRDVVAHLTLPPTLTTAGWMKELLRSGGSFHRMVRDSAVRTAREPAAGLVARLREHAGSRLLPPAPGAGADTTVMDVLTHSQDIAVPLGREIEIVPDAARAGLESLWRLRFPFNPRKALSGIRFVATDSAWDIGDGPVVTGPASALLLVLTNREAGLERVSGAGVPLLRARLP
ncbi:maleylpyruvate isomerase family mycothiol-dependent enzyme [Streptomyces sp. NBC_01754]|uniref:maleylpyruvate isomerase family mycothiol-dependent enzyme n=1 Tax=Streptomyces sp. NBC_01754 TaxID=2975930 RepID=UPI002DD89361|nr:maleylpyruvate isomerase family mycothiol-dependent enzyme [Streptomyces sp. NBC_01754]WSC90940.1 maleylpyruvate isomerase family mycothiol-dependent enzyme [Streptomyces sp. NBC_01754]WSC96566.1 maleylpyruvate isomerase family mycothiol-dependent enzyme [Streptomyces sp. NBC_01754]